MTGKGRRRLILVAVAVFGGLTVGVVGSQIQGDGGARATTTTTMSLEHELADRACLETVDRATFLEGPWGAALRVEHVTDLASEADDVFPTATVAVPDTDTILIAGREGTVWAMTEGGQPELVLDLRAVTTYEGDGGVLNLAIDEERSVLYVLRTAEAGATTLTSHPLAPEGPEIGEGTEILRVGRPGTMHAGGALVALDDGTVLVGIGDGGGIGGPDERAQQGDSLLGKLVRIDPRVGEDPPYVVPSDNPKGTADETFPEMVALGLRNPYRAAVDEESGNLYLPDVGQSCREEINVLPAQPWVPRNFGWPMWEGSHRFKPGGDVSFGHTPPTYDYLEGCAVIGGYVYHGTAVPELDGRYLYGDWCKGWIRALSFDEAGGVVVEPVAEVASPTSISEGPDGEPWITTATDGVYRLVPAPTTTTTAGGAPTSAPDAGSSPS